MWDFLSGDIPAIKLQCSLLKIDDTWHGNYYKDKQYRDTMGKKLDLIWQEKDQLLQSLEQD